MTESTDSIEQVLAERGISRRNFLRFCTAMAAALAMPGSVSKVIAKALAAPKKPPR